MPEHSICNKHSFIYQFKLTNISHIALVKEIENNNVVLLCEPVAAVNKLFNRFGTNQFFQTLAAAFPMALMAYAFGALGLADNPDCVTIGSLMMLVPGLLITNAMRDIIYGDTNSGINRLVQVLLIAAAIALGTAAAWNLASAMWGVPTGSGTVTYSLPWQCLHSFFGCLGCRPCLLPGR